MSGVGSCETGLSTFSTSDYFLAELFGWGSSPSFCSILTFASAWSDYFSFVTITGGGPGAATSLPLLRVIALQCSFPYPLGFTFEVLCNEP